MDALTSFETIRRQLSGKMLLLLLDFDGTLSPIAPTPQKAVIDADIYTILQKLSKKKTMFLAIISGRSLDNIQEKVGISTIMYAGNHGLEYSIFGKTTSFALPKALQMQLSLLYKDIQTLLTQYSGAWIEDKRITIAVYYHTLTNNAALSLEKDIQKLLQQYNNNQVHFVLTHGKKVFEIIPNVGKNKGTVSRFILKKVCEKTKQPTIPIYIGDDTTDEDAFTQLSTGITIHVGKSDNTAATYTLQDIKAVYTFLSRLSSL